MKVSCVREIAMIWGVPRMNSLTCEQNDTRAVELNQQTRKNTMTKVDGSKSNVFESRNALSI